MAWRRLTTRRRWLWFENRSQPASRAKRPNRAFRSIPFWAPGSGDRNPHVPPPLACFPRQRMKNSTSKPKSFRATLEHLRSGLGWVIVRIPFDVKKTWGGARVKVRGEVNWATFRTSVFPEKDGGAFLLINKQLQKAARIMAGSTAEFHVELDTAPREVEVPVELARILL